MYSRGTTPPLISSQNSKPLATGFHGFHGQHNVTVLTLTAGLTNELAVDVGDLLADGFAVGHLRLTHVGFHAEFTLHAVDDDFQGATRPYRR